MIPSPENCFSYNKLKENPEFFYKKYDHKAQQIMFFIILCLFSVGSYYTFNFCKRMPSYIFESLINYPCTFAVDQNSTNFFLSFTKFSFEHTFFSMAINFTRVYFKTEYTSANITINSQFKFYNHFNLDFEENTTFSDMPIEFFKNEIYSPTYLFYIRQGINFTDFDVNFEVSSTNFSEIILVGFTCYMINPNTWNFTYIFRMGVFYALSYFLFGVLLCYCDNNDFPLHKEFLLLLIVGIIGVNPFQKLTSHEFLWFRYTYLMMTVFYACYRLFMLRFVYFLKGKNIQFFCQNAFKWIGYISIIFIEIIEIWDVLTHNSNYTWIYDPYGTKSLAVYITIAQNIYYCLLMTYILFKVFGYTKASADQTKMLANYFFLIILFISIIYNFYVECIYGLFNHLRQKTPRFFIESLNAYLVLLALSFVHNTRCISIPKYD